MESANIAEYDSAMQQHDLPKLLGSALRDIRKRVAGTQDDWADATGMSQSYLSAAERGESGWDSVRTITNAVEKAGADPLDLLRLALAKVELDEERQELLNLWTAADDEIRRAILTLLRVQVAARAAAR